MQEFIHSLTGTRMFVADDRVEEYRAAGHRPIIPDKENRDNATRSDETKPEETAQSASESHGNPKVLQTQKPPAKKSATAQKPKSTAKA